MIPIKTIVIEQVLRDISSVKQAYVKLACNRVISPGISHNIFESVETAMRTFMFGRLFSIFHHAIKAAYSVTIYIFRKKMFSF